MSFGDPLRHFENATISSLQSTASRRMPIDQSFRLEEMAPYFEPVYFHLREAICLRSVGADITVAAVNNLSWATALLHDTRPLWSAYMGEVFALKHTFEPSTPTEDGPDSDYTLAAVATALGAAAGQALQYASDAALAHFDVPVPRPPDEPTSFTVANINDFIASAGLDAAVAWSWIVARTLAMRTIYSGPVRPLLDELLVRGARGGGRHLAAKTFELAMTSEWDQNMSVEELHHVDFDWADYFAPAPLDSEGEHLAALVATIEAYLDFLGRRTMKAVLPHAKTTIDALSAHMAARPLEASAYERWLGLCIEPHHRDQATAFIDEAAKAGGVPALQRMWNLSEAIPGPDDFEDPKWWDNRTRGLTPPDR